MITAVFYDPETGDILATTQGPPAALNADPRPWVEAAVFQMDYDRTHMILNGVLTPVINAVFYDAESGAALESVRVVDESTLSADGRPWVRANEVRADWSQTHTVVDGVLTPKAD